MGAGFHGLNGVGPEVSRHIWSIYVRPRLTYGLEALILSPVDIKSLEEYYRSNLRAILHLPKSTGVEALYLLAGQAPIEAQIHITTLTFFANALRREGSIEAQVIQRQLAMKNEDSLSWVWYVQNLLKLYNLPSAFTLLFQQPTKDRWKRMVKGAVLNKWEKQLKEEACKKKTLHLINLEACSLSAVHHVWRLGAADTLTVLKATTKAKLLVQRYPLFYSRTSGVNYGRNCPLCKSEPETLAHFLLDCQELSSVRKPHINKLLRVPDVEQHTTQADKFVKLILDPSHFICDESLLEIESLTRDLCFALHHARSTYLGYSSRYKHPHHHANLLQG